MVSLSNHEAVRTAGRAEPSWFDKLTMKATWRLHVVDDHDDGRGTA